MRPATALSREGRARVRVHPRRGRRAALAMWQGRVSPRSPTRAPITAPFLTNDQSVGVLVQPRGHALRFRSLSGMIQLERSTSAPNERVLRVTQLVKLSFNYPSVVVTADVFQYIYEM